MTCQWFCGILIASGRHNNLGMFSNFNQSLLVNCKCCCVIRQLRRLPAVFFKSWWMFLDFLCNVLLSTVLGSMECKPQVGWSPTNFLGSLFELSLNIQLRSRAWDVLSSDWYFHVLLQLRRPPCLACLEKSSRKAEALRVHFRSRHFWFNSTSRATRSQSDSLDLSRSTLQRTFSKSVCEPC